MCIKKVFFLLFIGLSFSCASNQESKESKSEQPKDTSNKKLVIAKTDSSKIEARLKEDTSENQKENDCNSYWQKRFPRDSVKVKILNEIIRNNHESLTLNNIAFLKSLKKEKQGLAFNKTLNPIFRLKEAVGLIFYPKYKRTEDSIIPLTDEIPLIEKHDTSTLAPYLSHNELRFFPDILDSIYLEKEKPSINYYTSNRMGSAQISDLGKYFGECLEYLEYSIDTSSISIEDSLLFASPMKIELEFYKNSRVDSLLKSSYNNACYDCPSSDHLQRTFALFKGVKNLYFVYADTYPVNDELHTPSRALIYVNTQNEIIYLWYSEVDLFGCSCL